MSTRSSPVAPEVRWLDLRRRRELLFWESFTDGATRPDDVSPEIFALSGEILARPAPTERAEAFLRKLALLERVETDPEILALCRHLEDWNNYTQGLASESRIELRAAVGGRMRDDVLALMKLRNERSRRLGFASFPELVFHSSELDLEAVRSAISQWHATHLPRFNELVKSYELTWTNWYENLADAAPLDETFDTRVFVTEFFELIGKPSMARRIAFHFDDDCMAGYTAAVSIPDDVRVLVGPIDSVLGLRLFLRDVGRALVHANNAQSGILALQTPSSGDVLGGVLEHLALDTIFEDFEREVASHIGLLETMRAATSFLFEMDLWQNPEAAEALFERHHSVLALPPLPASVWAADAFRSVDAVQVHTTVLAEMWGSATAERYRSSAGTAPAHWFAHAFDELCRNGSMHTLSEKLAPR